MITRRDSIDTSAAAQPACSKPLLVLLIARLRALLLLLLLLGLLPVEGDEGRRALVVAPPEVLVGRGGEGEGNEHGRADVLCYHCQRLLQSTIVGIRQRCYEPSSHLPLHLREDKDRPLLEQARGRGEGQRKGKGKEQK